MHCDVMMVVERVTVKRRMRMKGKGEEVERHFPVSFKYSYVNLNI
jgi:hypothetical protein